MAMNINAAGYTISVANSKGQSGVQHFADEIGRLIRLFEYGL